MLNTACTHPVGHRHGTRVCYVLDKCRCEPCTLANRAAANARRREIAYGIPAYVDAQPARDHVRALQAAGLGWKRVAHMAGLNTSVVWALIYGKPDRGMQPSQRIRPKTAAAILAVPMPTVHDLGKTVSVDATGTRRRLHALMCLGWSIQRLAEEHAVDRQALDNALTAVWVHAQTAVTVREMYADKSMRPAPAATWHQKGSVTRARNRAAREGWVPPLGWDDLDLDDPAAQPVLTDVGRTHFDLDEWVRLVGFGEHPDRAATRCGVRMNTVKQTAHRAGRIDEVRALLTSRAA